MDIGSQRKQVAPIELSQHTGRRLQSVVKLFPLRDARIQFYAQLLHSDLYSELHSHALHCLCSLLQSTRSTDENVREESGYTHKRGARWVKTNWCDRLICWNS
jgi:hypothetical protein